MADRMWFHSVDYKRDRGELDRAWVNRGWWLHGTPRLMPLCRVFGHKPVVDGVDYRPMHTARGIKPGERSRWAVCDRCGIRLQQPIDSDLEIGQPYADPLVALLASADVTGARGVIGGQLIVGRSFPGVSAEVKVGNMGSEQTLAAHLRVSPLGALYVHTEAHGTWLQRRLNPRGYQSRVIGVSIGDGRLRWDLWTKRDERSSRDPWWMHGSVQIDPRTILFGPARYSYEDVGDPQQVTVRMPHGDDHQVTVQLQQVRHGRKRLRSRARTSWTVDWRVRPGIPTKPGDRGRIYGSGVKVSAASVREDAWPAEAAAAIAAQMTRDRSRYGFQPEALAPP